MKNREKTIILISIIIIGVILVAFYYMNKTQVFNKTISDANKAVVAEQYDKAITLYQEALNYKIDSEVNKKIDMAKLLKRSKAVYDIAIKQTTDKNYLGAINNFRKVDKQDTKRYTIARSKISECTKLYIADNLKDAKKVTTYNKALQTVISSNDFKREIKGLTKKTDTYYVSSDNITGVSLDPDGYSGKEEEPWIAVKGNSNDELGWSIANGKKVFSISLGYVGQNITNTAQGYWVEYNTGKLIRWDNGEAKEVN